MLVGFPLAVVLLGEIVTRLRRAGHPLARPLRLIRGGVLPTLTFWLFLLKVIELKSDSIEVRIASTAFYLVSLAAALGLLNVLLFESAEKTSWRSRVPALFLDITRFILVLVGTSVLLATVWDQDLSQLLTALGVGSIVIGLALQDTLGNIFAGIAILFEKPYVEGDWIRYDDHLGKVVEINWRSTRLMTHFGDTVIVPNGEIARGVLMNENNLTLPRYETFDIGFDYSHPPNEVKQVLIDTVTATDGVLADPAPQVYVTTYNDFSIDYQIRFAVADIATLPAVRDNFVTRIWYAAKRHGLTIPFPIRTVHHYNGARLDRDSERQEIDRGHGAVGDVLPIDPTDIDAAETRVERYGAGEVIQRRGEVLKELALIVAGRVLMESGDQRPDVPLGVGEMFGIESVLRNAPSAYEVYAVEDTIVVEMSRDFVTDLVAAKPGFAHQLEQTIENRIRK